MHAINLKGVEFTAFLLKNVAYQWYEKLEAMRGDNAEQAMQDDFSRVVIDHFFPQELREDKVKEFVNLKQGKMSMKEFALKFQQFSHYALDLVDNMRSKMRKFASGLSRDLVLKCKATIQNNDIDISRIVFYMQQIENGKKYVEIREEYNKMFRYSEKRGRLEK